MWNSNKETAFGQDVEITNEKTELNFARTYHAPINSEVTLQIEIRYYMGMMYSGTLRQRGGRWVSFDPKDPADKILDRDILPIIEKKCEGIITADRAWRSKNPPEFTDTQGRTWIRK